MYLTRTENPLSRAYWIGIVDPRPFALFRIALGLAFLHDLIPYSRNVRAFLSDEGVLPRSCVREWWSWSVFSITGSPTGVTILFALGALAILAFTIGFKTRVASVLSWLFVISLHHRNHFVTDGGDDFTRILFFWSMFADLGARYSVDSWRRSNKTRSIPAFGPRVLQANVVVLYLIAGLLKLRLGWLRGDAVYMTLELKGFCRPLGAWLMHHQGICTAMTYGTLVVEIAFAAFAYSPFKVQLSRAIAVASGLSIQIGILLTMRVGIFTEVMIAVCALWIQPEWIDAAKKRWLVFRGRWSEDLEAEMESSPSEMFRASRKREMVMRFLAGAQFLIAVWDPFFGRRVPLPFTLVQERRALSLLQPYALFDHGYPRPSWQGPGELADGTAIDVVDELIPGAHPREPGLHFSRWTKFTYKMDQQPFFPELAAYLCRAYNDGTRRPALVRFRLIVREQAPTPPGTPPAPVQELDLIPYECPHPVVASLAP